MPFPRDVCRTTLCTLRLYEVIRKKVRYGIVTAQGRRVVLVFPFSQQQPFPQDRVFEVFEHLDILPRNERVVVNIRLHESRIFGHTSVPVGLVESIVQITFRRVEGQQ